MLNILSFHSIFFARAGASLVNDEIFTIFFAVHRLSVPLPGIYTCDRYAYLGCQIQKCSSRKMKTTVVGQNAMFAPASVK